MRVARAAALGALLTGCAVAGAPKPAQPTPPEVLKVLSSPAGWRVHLSARRALVWLGDAEPVLTQGAVIRVPRRAGQTPPRLRVGGVDHVAPGPPGPPIPLVWTPPPPAPPAPLAFFAGETVQVSWLPPPEGTRAVHLLRDGAPIQRVPADAAGAQDPAPSGVHRYTVRFEGAHTLTAPSPPAAVTVP